MVFESCRVNGIVTDRFWMRAVIGPRRRCLAGQCSAAHRTAFVLPSFGSSIRRIHWWPSVSSVHPCAGMVRGQEASASTATSAGAASPSSASSSAAASASAAPSGPSASPPAAASVDRDDMPVGATAGVRWQFAGRPIWQAKGFADIFFESLQGGEAAGGAAGSGAALAAAAGSSGLVQGAGSSLKSGAFQPAIDLLQHTLSGMVGNHGGQ